MKILYSFGLFCLLCLNTWALAPWQQALSLDARSVLTQAESFQTFLEISHAQQVTPEHIHHALDTLEKLSDQERLTLLNITKDDVTEFIPQAREFFQDHFTDRNISIYGLNSLFKFLMDNGHPLLPVFTSPKNLSIMLYLAFHEHNQALFSGTNTYSGHHFEADFSGISVNKLSLHRSIIADFLSMVPPMSLAVPVNSNTPSPNSQDLLIQAFNDMNLNYQKAISSLRAILKTIDPNFFEKYPRAQTPGNFRQTIELEDFQTHKISTSRFSRDDRTEQKLIAYKDIQTIFEEGHMLCGYFGHYTLDPLHISAILDGFGDYRETFQAILKQINQNPQKYAKEKIQIYARLELLKHEQQKQQLLADKLKQQSLLVDLQEKPNESSEMDVAISFDEQQIVDGIIENTLQVQYHQNNQTLILYDLKTSQSYPWIKILKAIDWKNFRLSDNQKKQLMNHQIIYYLGLGLTHYSSNLSPPINLLLRNDGKSLRRSYYQFHSPANTNAKPPEVVDQLINQWIHQTAIWSLIVQNDLNLLPNQNASLQRFIHLGGQDIALLKQKKQTNSAWHDPGFVSATQTTNISPNYHLYYANTLIRIPQAGQAKNIQSFSMYSHEEEFMLSAQSSFKVLDVFERSDSSQAIKFEDLPEHITSIVVLQPYTSSTQSIKKRKRPTQLNNLPDKQAESFLELLETTQDDVQQAFQSIEGVLQTASQAATSAHPQGSFQSTYKLLTQILKRSHSQITKEAQGLSIKLLNSFAKTKDPRQANGLLVNWEQDINALFKSAQTQKQAVYLLAIYFIIEVQREAKLEPKRSLLTSRRGSRLKQLYLLFYYYAKGDAPLDILEDIQRQVITDSNYLPIGQTEKSIRINELIVNMMILKFCSSSIDKGVLEVMDNNLKEKFQQEFWGENLTEPFKFVAETHLWLELLAFFPEKQSQLEQSWGYSWLELFEHNPIYKPIVQRAREAQVQLQASQALKQSA